MENLEEKIMDVLGDPEKLEQIMGIAKNLGFSPPQDEEPVTEQDSNTASVLTGLLQQVNTTDHRQEALLHALIPYLQPDRQKKLRRAIRVAKLSHLAGFALKNYSDQL